MSSNTPFDDRLARLAPATSPDPERFEAARSRVAEEILDPDGPSASRSSGSDSSTTHRVDLDDHRIEPVTPLDAEHRARMRRGRRWTLAAAAAGVVAVVGTAVVLSPVGSEIRPAWLSQPVSECAEIIDSTMAPAEVPAGLSWRAVVQDSTDDTDTTVLLSEDDRFAAACATWEQSGSGTSTYSTWTLPELAVGSDELVPRGVETQQGFLVWGVAGDQVDSVNIRTPVESNSPAGTGYRSGRSTLGVWTSAPALLSEDAYWAIFLPPDDAPDDAEIDLEWTLADGTENSLSLDDAWPGVEEWNPIAEARRAECRSIRDWQIGERFSPVLEYRSDGYGTTLYADGGTYRLCVQDADPPYAKQGTSAGDMTSDPPPPDGLGPVLGAGFGEIWALHGQVGTDVEQIVVTLADGTRVDAEVQNGYWLAQAHGAARGDGEVPWEGADLAWYLSDGSLGGRQPASEHS